MAERMLEIGLASRAAPGEERSGDVGVVELRADRALVAAVDAVGHGPEAARTAGIAAAAVREFASEPPPALVARCHERLRGTRGVAVSLAAFSSSEGTITWLGVGNVEGRLVRTAPGGSTTVASLATAPGTVGDALPALTVERGDALVFATDGLRRGFADELDLVGPAQRVADRLLEEHGRAVDDALVLVARLLGGAS
jgi:hypothetical protein